MVSPENIGILAVIFLVVSVVGFFVVREITLWYFRINRIVANQEITNDLLRKIYEYQTGEAYEIERDLSFKAKRFTEETMQIESEEQSN